VANSSVLEIYLIRHGETEWSLSGQHTGITDLPLTPRGEQRAAALHPRLSQIHFDAVFSSPMQRARRTAELAGFGNPQVTPLLQEVDYGEYEGLTRAQIKSKRPNWELFRDGCPGGETPEQIYARAQAFIELASEQGGRILAFGHGHFLRVIGVAWIDAAIVLAGRLYLDVATLSALRHDDRGRVIAVWNAG
jgi:probable phosphoglycerate mutase